MRRESNGTHSRRPRRRHARDPESIDLVLPILTLVFGMRSRAAPSRPSARLCLDRYSRTVETVRSVEEVSQGSSPGMVLLAFELCSDIALTRDPQNQRLVERSFQDLDVDGAGEVQEGSRRRGQRKPLSATYVRNDEHHRAMAPNALARATVATRLRQPCRTSASLSPTDCRRCDGSGVPPDPCQQRCDLRCKRGRTRDAQPRRSRDARGGDALDDLAVRSLRVQAGRLQLRP